MRGALSQALMDPGDRAVGGGASGGWRGWRTRSRIADPGGVADGGSSFAFSLRIGRCLDRVAGGEAAGEEGARAARNVGAHGGGGGGGSAGSARWWRFGAVFSGAGGVSSALWDTGSRAGKPVPWRVKRQARRCPTACRGAALCCQVVSDGSKTLRYLLMNASLSMARKLVASFSYRVPRRRLCLSQPTHRSTTFRSL